MEALLDLLRFVCFDTNWS